VPVEIGRRLAGAIPAADLEVVPDAGHYLVVDHGTEVFTRLRADGGI
jgi:pimeloyl-ACP methyl ester carboxylesterase